MAEEKEFEDCPEYQYREVKEAFSLFPCPFALLLLVFGAVAGLTAAGWLVMAIWT